MGGMVLDDKGAERLNEKLERLSRLGDTETASFIAKELENFYNLKLKDFDPKSMDPAETKKRLEIIKKIGDVNMMVGRVDKGKEYYHKVLSLAPGSEVAAAVHRRFAWISVKDSDWRGAIDGYKQALDISKKCKDELGVGKATRGLGYIAWRRGDFEEAFEKFNIAAQIFENLKAQSELGMSLIDIGNIHSEKGYMEKALEVYRKALAALQKTNNIQDLGRVYNNIGNNMMILGQYEKAVPYLNEEVKLGKKHNDKVLVAMGQLHLTDCMARLGKLDEARELGKQALKGFSDAGYKLGVTMSSYPIGVAEWFAGNHDEASKIMETGIADAEKQGLIPMVAEFSMDYGKLLKEAGDGLKAKKQLKKALALFVKMKADGYVKMVEGILKEIE
jgi:tetratricopeptide (TPR) repeat protein